MKSTQLTQLLAECKPDSDHSEAADQWQNTVRYFANKLFPIDGPYHRNCKNEFILNCHYVNKQIMEDTLGYRCNFMFDNIYRCDENVVLWSYYCRNHGMQYHKEV